MVGPVILCSFKSRALLLVNASDAAGDSTIPRQPVSVLKIRVLHQRCHHCVSLETSRRFASAVRCSNACLSAEADAGERTRYSSQVSRKNEKITIQSDNCIYMSRRFSRLNCPAKQPHIFESCIRVQTRNVIIFIPVHCVHYLPVRFKPAPSTVHCRSTRYNTMSCLPNLDISHSGRSSAAQHKIYTIPQLSTEVAEAVCGTVRDYTEDEQSSL